MSRASAIVAITRRCLTRQPRGELALLQASAAMSHEAQHARPALDLASLLCTAPDHQRMAYRIRLAPQRLPAWRVCGALG